MGAGRHRCRGMVSGLWDQGSLVKRRRKKPRGCVAAVAGASQEIEREPSGFRVEPARVGLGVHVRASVDHSAETAASS